MRKSLNKESKKPRTKAPKIQHRYSTCVLQTSVYYLEETVYKENKEEAAECAKFLPRERLP